MSSMPNSLIATFAFLPVVIILVCLFHQRRAIARCLEGRASSRRGERRGRFHARPSRLSPRQNASTVSSEPVSPAGLRPPPNVIHVSSSEPYPAYFERGPYDPQRPPPNTPVVPPVSTPSGNSTPVGGSGVSPAATYPMYFDRRPFNPQHAGSPHGRTAAQRASAPAAVMVNVALTQGRVTVDDLIPIRVKETDETACPICFDPLNEGAAAAGPCLHTAHTACLESWLAKDVTGSCPVCRERYIDVDKSAMNAMTAISAA